MMTRDRMLPWESADDTSELSGNGTGSHLDAPTEKND